MYLYRSTREGAPFSRHFLRPGSWCASVCDQPEDLGPTVRIRDLNRRRFGGLQASPGLRFTCWAGTDVTEAPAAACDVDDFDAAPLATAVEWAVGRPGNFQGLETWMPREQQAPLVWLGLIGYATRFC
jgi:hypothetical protein